MREISTIRELEDMLFTHRKHSCLGKFVEASRAGAEPDSDLVDARLDFLEGKARYFVGSSGYVRFFKYSEIWVADWGRPAPCFFENALAASALVGFAVIPSRGSEPIHPDTMPETREFIFGPHHARYRVHFSSSGTYPVLTLRPN